MSAKPGWYADPEMAGTRRYWDGAAWTDNRAPAERESLGFWTLTRAIVAGILIALVVAVVVYKEIHSTDAVDCATENAQHATNGEPLIDCG